jgi:hypothetical protein
MNDVSIARTALIHYLEDGERFEADDGYQGVAPMHAKVPNNITRKVENSRFKQWGCLRQRFRHDDLSKHSACFRSIAVILQISLNVGFHTVNPIDYTDE